MNKAGIYIIAILVIISAVIGGITLSKVNSSNATPVVSDVTALTTEIQELKNIKEKLEIIVEKLTPEETTTQEPTSQTTKDTTKITDNPLNTVVTGETKNTVTATLSEKIEEIEKDLDNISYRTYNIRNIVNEINEKASENSLKSEITQELVKELKIELLATKESLENRIDTKMGELKVAINIVEEKVDTLATDVEIHDGEIKEQISTTEENLTKELEIHDVKSRTRTKNAEKNIVAEVDENEQKLSELALSIDAHDVDIKTLIGASDVPNTVLGDIYTHDTAIKALLAESNSDIEEIKTNVAGITTILGTPEGASISEDIANTRNDIGILSTALETHDEDIKNLIGIGNPGETIFSVIGAIDTTIGTSEDSIDGTTIFARLNAINGKVDTINNKLGNYAGTGTDTVKDQITAINELMGTSEDIAGGTTVFAKLNSIETKIDTMTDTLTAIKTETDKLQAIKDKTDTYNAPTTTYLPTPMTVTSAEAANVATTTGVAIENVTAVLNELDTMGKINY